MGHRLARCHNAIERCHQGESKFQIMAGIVDQLMAQAAMAAAEVLPARTEVLKIDPAFFLVSDKVLNDLSSESTFSLLFI